MSCSASVFLLGLPPSFLPSLSRLRRSTLARACTPLTKSEEKERLLAVYQYPGLSMCAMLEMNLLLYCYCVILC